MIRPVQLTLPGIPVEPTHQEIRALVVHRLIGFAERQQERARRRVRRRELAVRAKYQRRNGGTP